MLNDFKAFILRGNVVDLAVGVVIGAAFGAVVTSLVEDVLTPLISIPGSANFGDLRFTVRDSVFAYGQFLNALIAFLLMAAAVYFFVVVPTNKLMARRKTEPDVASTTRDCPECLSSIPMAARRCAFCTAKVPPAAAAPTSAPAPAPAP
jgi:large conductance mechanosensitive channel